jgi:hypothetical protein
MISEESRAVAEKARQFYDTQLRKELERQYPGKYACIEPLSGRYFLGDTFDQAVNAAIDAFPERLTYTLQVGRPAALQPAQGIPRVNSQKTTSDPFAPSLTILVDN